MTVHGEISNLIGLTLHDCRLDDRNRSASSYNKELTCDNEKISFILFWDMKLQRG